MAVAAAIDVWAERRRRVAELRLRHGFVRQLLDFYGALLPVQEKAFVDAQSSLPPAASLVSYVAEMVVPSVRDVSIAVGPDRLRAELIESGSNSYDVIERWIRGDGQPMADGYLARASLGPVLEALGSDVKAVCTGPRDARHCPHCGGPPQLSYFAVAAEDLASGSRHLVCARCSSTWVYTRMTCAGCGEDTSSKLPIFNEEGTTSGERGSVVRGLPTPGAGGHSAAVFPHVRIEACDSCGQYLLGIDLASDPRAVPLVDELAAIPLDLYARERGYGKISRNLMGF